MFRVFYICTDGQEATDVAVGLYDIDYVCRFHHYLDIDICSDRASYSLM